jgi:ElaB/YqjD/DUF883 family membrane-anchored ribosome-binding protein
MTEEEKRTDVGSPMGQTEQTGKPEAHEPKSSEAWDEFGQQLQKLGDSIAKAFRTMADSINEAVVSPEAQKLRDEAKKVAQSAREAGEQAAEQLRPHLLSTLRQVNDEIQTLITNLEKKKAEETVVEGEVCESGEETA